MRRLYAWVDQEGTGLMLVFPKEADTRLEQMARLLTIAHLSAASLAANFQDASPESSPEFRAIGLAAGALARTILDFQDKARAELARSPIVPDEVMS